MHEVACGSATQEVPLPTPLFSKEILLFDLKELVYMSILMTKLMGLCFWSYGLCVQRLRFEAQVQTHNATMMAAAELAKAKGDTFAQAAANDAYEVGMDEDFVTALEYGMPPTAGMVRI